MATFISHMVAREARILPCEAVDCLYIPNKLWTSETNWCNPPSWTLLPDLVRKLCQYSAAATVIAPYGPTKKWFQLLSELAYEQIMYSPPDRVDEGVGSPGWSVTAFHVPRRP
jgi:hypothetical protein